MGSTASLVAPFPWQSTDWSRLLADLCEERLHHALLLSGPSGIGKRLLAERLARSLVCATPAGGGDCGQCRGCRLMQAGTHPDCLRIAPEEPGKQIRIAQVREELIDFVMRTASIATRKVVLIEPADAMNTATANCLLKSLEEPAPGTYLLLVTDTPARLLPTIRSRCRTVALRPPGWEEALQWLIARRGEANAEDLLGAASGRPLEALRLDGTDALRQFDRAADLLLRSAYPDPWYSALAGEVADVDVHQLLSWMQIYLGDLSRWMAWPASSRLPRALAVHEAMRTRVSEQSVARLLRDTLRAARDARSTTNPNKTLLLESLLAGWQGRAADA